MSLTTLKLKKQMSLTVGPFSRAKAVVRAQVWVSTVRIWRLIRILARFGRTGLPRVSGPDNFGINDLLTRDSCELSEIRPQIQNMHKKLGHMWLFGVCPGNFGSSYGWVFVSRPGWTGAGIRNSGPVRRSGIPNRTLTNSGPVRGSGIPNRTLT